MVKRVAFGDIANDHVRELHDLSSREFLILGIMALAVLYMGVYPKPFTDVMHTSVEALLQHVSNSKL
jgi:NADH-quinone oxidoreductase subunit M